MQAVFQTIPTNEQLLPYASLPLVLKDDRSPGFVMTLLGQLQPLDNNSDYRCRLTIVGKHVQLLRLSIMVFDTQIITSLHRGVGHSLNKHIIPFI